MLNYIVFVNNRKNVIVVDYETDIKDCIPDIGYEIDGCWDWWTDKEEYSSDDVLTFDSKKVFKEPGLYKVTGYDDSSNTQDGWIYIYRVTKVERISDSLY